MFLKTNSSKSVFQLGIKPYHSLRFKLFPDQDTPHGGGGGPWK